MIYGLINSNPKIIDSMPFHQSYTTKIYGFLKWVCSTYNDTQRLYDEGVDMLWSSIVIWRIYFFSLPQFYQI